MNIDSVRERAQVLRHAMTASMTSLEEQLGARIRDLVSLREKHAARTDQPDNVHRMVAAMIGARLRAAERSLRELPDARALLEATLAEAEASLLLDAAAADLQALRARRSAARDARRAEPEP